MECTPASGVAQFLRHFVPRKDESHSSPARRRHGSLSTRTFRSTAITTANSADPTEDLSSSSTPRDDTRNLLSPEFKSLARESAVSFVEVASAVEKGVVAPTTISSTRLGICPTRYAIPPAFARPTPVSPSPPSSTATSPSSAALDGESPRNRGVDSSLIQLEETGTDPLFPVLFDSLSLWEESTKYHLESSAAEPPPSPQRSVGARSSADSDCGGSNLSRSSYTSSSCRSVKSMRSTTSRLFGGGSRSSNRSNDSKTAKAASAMRRAKDIVTRARHKDSNSVGSGWRRSMSPATATSVHSSASSVGTDGSSSVVSPSSKVKVFLLLLEPDTKVFELIQLVYPRKTTKVGDLLRMIPKDATEPSLAQQAYMGVVRPKRRSKPILDLKLLASNNVLSTIEETAGIVNGEIIVAIPAHASAQQMIHLSKQILASSQVQALIAKSNRRSSSSGASPQRSVGSRQGGESKCAGSNSGESVGSSGSIQSRTSKKGTSKASTTPLPPEAQLTLRATQRAQTFLVNQAIKVERPSPPNLDDAFFHGYGQFERSCRNKTTHPSPFFSDNVSKSFFAEKETKHEVEFCADMLNTYLSEKAVQNFCSGGDSDECKLTTTDRSSPTVSDELSLDDGSLTSSFQHWSQSFRAHPTRFDSSDGIDSSSLRNNKKRTTKQITSATLQVAWLGILISIIRYNLDPNGRSGMQRRQGHFEESMTCWEVMMFLVCFVSIAKVQRIIQHNFCTKSNGRCRCPVMLMISQANEDKCRFDLSHVPTR